MKLYDEADFNQGDVAGHADVSSVEECVTLCVANAECQYFTYVSDKKKCWLKDWISIINSRHLKTKIIKINTNFLLLNNILQTEAGRHLTRISQVWLLVLDAASLIIS